MPYRLLNREERIEPGDEVLLDDASTWAPLDLSGVDRIAGNASYDPNFHQPMRREMFDRGFQRNENNEGDLVDNSGGKVSDTAEVAAAILAFPIAII